MHYDSPAQAKVLQASKALGSRLSERAVGPLINEVIDMGNTVVSGIGEGWSFASHATAGPAACFRSLPIKVALSVLVVALMAWLPATAFAQCRGDKASAPPQVDSSGSYTFAYFRLDELGRRMYCDAVTNITESMGKSTTAGPLVVVFVHGWKHDASPEDGNVQSFRALLAELADSQATHSSLWRRRVVGVYVAWPANDASMLGPLQNLTFWEMRDRTDRIARAGEVSKLLNHLNAAVPQSDGLLVVIGHSFGARLVFESVQQTIASNVVREGKASPGETCRGNRVCHRVHGFGDLVVLLNPAFEAAQYTTFYQFSGGNWAASVPNDPAIYQNVEAWPDAQPPLILTIGAENDDATSTAWTWAHADGDPTLRTTLTNYRPYVTHELRCVEGGSASTSPEPPSGPISEVVAGVLDRTRPFGPIGCATLTPVGVISNSPFIVARADSQIIHGHTGIWMPALRQFLVGYLNQLHEAKRIKGWR